MKQRIFFNNGYGVSIINNDVSYGLELAVLKGNEESYELCYDTPVTPHHDVFGHLHDDEVDEIIKQVKALPKCN
jgi:hypothetical protein